MSWLLKCWRVYGPEFRMHRFRLYGPAAATATRGYFPFRIAQIVGTRRWSLAITWLGDLQIEEGRSDGLPDHRAT